MKTTYLALEVRNQKIVCYPVEESGNRKPEPERFRFLVKPDLIEG